MYKNKLQELAQRSCFNLPSYACIREGPDHAPRFKATVNFNGEVFESPHYCSTLRQAEHSAAEVALNYLSHCGPSHSLAARILDETGVYKNLLQEIAQRVGAPLPQYTTFRSGLGHLPVFTGTVELARITFTGESAKNKKQAEKNAAMAAWSSLKQLAKVAKETASSSSEHENNDELEQITIARALLTYRLKEKMSMANPTGPIMFPRKFPVQNPRPTSPQPPSVRTSKILPLICQKQAPRSRYQLNGSNVSNATNESVVPSSHSSPVDSQWTLPQRFAASGAVPYVPIRQMRTPCHRMAPPVTIRTSVPVFFAPPLPPPSGLRRPAMCVPPVRVAPQVTIRHAVPVFAAPPVRRDDPEKDDLPTSRQENSLKDLAIRQKEDFVVISKETSPSVTAPVVTVPAVTGLTSAAVIAPSLPNKSIAQLEKIGSTSANDLPESKTVQALEQLQICTTRGTGGYRP